MTRLEDRQILVRDIEQACADGARLAPACALAGIDARTLRRWKAGDGLFRGDRRPDADRPIPSHALSEAEQARIIEIANEPRFADTPPARIVPALADEGIYIASESSFHRVLRAHGQMSRRGRAQPPRTSRPPTTHIATRPGDVWCWDVTLILSANSGNCQCGQCYVRCRRVAPSCGFHPVRRDTACLGFARARRGRACRRMPMVCCAYEVIHVSSSSAD
jgi:hypothetical protein